VGIGNQFYLGMTDQFLREHAQRPANSRPIVQIDLMTKFGFSRILA
jgi:hypothetical protein